MNKETYIRMTEPYRQNPTRAKRLEWINKLLTMVIYISYPALLLWLLFNRTADLTKAILVPLDGFIILSVFRQMVNRRRPYEYFELPPIIPKDTKGRSFPSRHVFSASVIALTFCFQSGLGWIGGILFAAAVGIAVVRVLAGVHFISDVLAGILAAIVCALMGFCLF